MRVYQPTKEEQIMFGLPESWVKWARSEFNFTTGRGIRSAVSGMPLFGVSLAGLAEMEEVA